MMASISQTDSHPSPPPGFFRGRIRKSKYMDYRKTVEESKGDNNEHRNLKQKRVFGTQRSTNVLVKSKTEKKSTGESLISTPVKQPIDEGAQKDVGVEPGLTEKAEGSKAKATEKDKGSKKGDVAEKAVEKSAGEIEMKPKKKSVGFQEKVDEEVSAPRTPVLLSSSLRQPRRSGTPYHTAKNCSWCRLDKLESSNYWMEQIKLAEHVGKHFASGVFFQLAHKCNAEPARSLKMELKKYLSRHGHLGKQKEWIEASRNYGLPVPWDDDKSSGERVDSKDLSNPEDDSNAITGSDGHKGSNT